MPAQPQTLLVVDPDPDFLLWVVKQLEAPGLRVLTATTSDAAWRLYGEAGADILITETHLHPFSGLDLLARVRQRDANALVILTSAFGTTQTVIESMKLGAFDFVRKEALPFNLKAVVRAALGELEQMRAAVTFQPQLTVEQYQESLVGQSPAMQEVFKLVGRVAHSDAPVMITGESGCGKELVARAIHTHSARSGRDFVAINCAAIPEALLESELFGHEKGAFSGAHAQRVGRFEQSDGGTLFLDEIGDMPHALQSKILRLLQEGEFTRVGGNETRHADVRIIAATNKNLEQEVAARRFREDLFYRLNVVRIQLPPLRQRVEDIRLLADYFLQRAATRRHLPRLQLSEEALRVMETYPWPGNVRELENTLQRAAVLATSGIIRPKDLPLGKADAPGSGGGEAEDNGNSVETGASQPGQERFADGEARSGQHATAGLTKERAIAFLVETAQADPTVRLLPWLEREFTQHALAATRGNQVQAARLLGITRATLRKRMETFGLARGEG